MTLRDLAEKIYKVNDSCGCCSHKTTSQMMSEVESLLCAHDDELIERCAKIIDKETEDWSCPDCHDAMLYEVAKSIRQLKSDQGKP